MLTLTLTLPIADWSSKLEIEDFDSYKGPVSFKADDSETVESEGEDPQHPGVSIEAELLSGQHNYWLVYNVWKDGELIEWSEPEFELQAGDFETDSGIGYKIVAAGG